MAGFVLAGDLDLQRAVSYRTATFADLAAAVLRGEGHLCPRCPPRLRMARRPSGRGEQHAPFSELEAHRHYLPLDRPDMVHCAAGFRASIAASQLSAWGMSPVLVDDVFEHSALHDLRLSASNGAER